MPGVSGTGPCNQGRPRWRRRSCAAWASRAGLRSSKRGAPAVRGSVADRGGPESRARGCAVTQASPGQGGARPTPDGPPLFPAPHLPLETPAVNLFLAHVGGKRPFSSVPLWRPTAEAAGGPGHPPLGLPTPPPLVGTGLPQAQVGPHPTTLPPFSAPNRQSLGHRRQDVRMSHASCSRRVRVHQTRPVHVGCQACCCPSSGPPGRTPLLHNEASLLGLV